MADQRERELISCPVCGSVSNEIALPSVMYIGKEGFFTRCHERKPETRLMKQAYGLLKDYIEHHFENVGERFAEVAVNIHLGLEEERNIWGTTTKSEEECLKEEGIAFIKIPSIKLDS